MTKSVTWSDPCRCADDKPFVPEYQVSKEKAKSLGIEFTPFEQSIKETVESLKEKNFLVASVALWMYQSWWGTLQIISFPNENMLQILLCAMTLWLALYAYAGI